MASSNRLESVPAQSTVLDADLIRKVSDLTRDVERFNSLVDRQRRLLQQQGNCDGAKGERQLREIRGRVRMLTTKLRAILDEIAVPVTES